MKKKIISIITVLLILLHSTSVFAATVSSKNTTFEVVEDNVCTINITDKAVFEKKMIDYDLEKKEATIQLKVTNNNITPLDKPSEIVFVIDNSSSMNDTISTGGTRMNAIADSAKLLATELLKLDTVKIGIVSFSSTYLVGQPAGSSYTPEGTIADGQLRLALTNSKNDIFNAISEIENGDKGARTNIDAGLQIASQQFSGTCESQFIILLTDGVPNLHVNDSTIYYDVDDINQTKNTLTSFNNKNIKIISMMTEVSNEQVSLRQTANDTTGIPTWQVDIAEAIFGTTSNPTTGKFYYITDDEIEETISNSILGELKAPSDGLLTDIDIYDYFPQEIVDNFDFEYVQQPTLGTASADIDLQNNRIIWHIDSLGYQESATLQYKLSLKDEIDENINNVVLNTNDGIIITTDKVLDENGNKKEITSDVTPKVRVNFVKEEPKEEPKKDDTVSPTPIPQTGATIALVVIITIAVIACAVIGIKYFIKNKDVK